MKKDSEYCLDETTHTEKEYKAGKDMEWNEVFVMHTKREAIKYAGNYLGNRKSTRGVRICWHNSTEGEEDIKTIFTKFIKSK